MMPPKLYELRVFKGHRQVDSPNRLWETLDLTDPVGTKDLLRRHLYAAAERDHTDRRQAHLYHLDVHEIRGERVENRALFPFSVPVEV